MTDRLKLALLVLVVLLIAAAHWLRPGPGYLRLNCHNTLYDASSEASGPEGFYLADYVFFGKSGRIYYRYFSVEGEPIATLMLSGKRVNRDPDNLVMDMDQFEPVMHQQDAQLPAHYHQLANAIASNVDRDGIHRVQMQVIERHDDDNAIVVRFEPSQMVCSCVYAG